MKLEDIISMVALPTTVGLFIISQIIENRKRRANLHIEAYYKIIYTPASEKLDTFIEHTEGLIGMCNEANHQYLKGMGLPFTETNKAEFLTEFGERKRKFEFAVINLYRLRYPSVADDMTDEILGIEDDFTTELDNILNGQADLPAFSSKLYTYRTRFYDLMLQPIEQQREAKKYPWQRKNRK